jgi:hypothetical protein
MKPVKSVFLFVISLVTFSSCFNPPEFDDTPQIDFKGVYFKDAQAIGQKDSLVLTISFRDGNGDLGLTADEIDPPYNDINYYLEKDGQLTPIGKRARYSNLPQFVDVPDGPNPGKLVTVRTRKNPAYSSLPSFNDPYACTFYIYDSLYISEEHENVFDDTYKLYKTYTSPSNPDVFVLLDTFYFQRNPNYLNIEVDFMVKQSDNSYVEFDWEKEFCTSAFNQRFPRLSEEDGPLEGDLQYALVSTGIRSVFNNRTLKLRVTIRDRALNASNTVESEDFLLDDI